MKTDVHISKITTFGALGYSSERIANLLDLQGEERVELISRLSNPTDRLKIAYEKGRAVGEYNIDIALIGQADKGDAVAIEALTARTKQRSMKDMKRELFGV